MAKILKKQMKTDNFIQKDKKEYIKYNEKVYIPKTQIHDILKQEHNLPAARHNEWARTHARIWNLYYWKEIKKSVQDYITKCPECIMNKLIKHEPYREMDIPEYSSEAWYTITMNWIIEFSSLKESMT
jgi:hypothetical protein